MAKSYLERRGPPDGATGRGGLPVPGDGDLAAFPALVEFLTAVKWPDGTDRRPGTLLLFWDDARPKVCLTDRAQGFVAFVTVDSLVDVFACVEESLRDGGMDWRPMKAPPLRSVRPR